MARPKKAAFERGEAKRAVIYIRVSTDEQKKGFGPEAQEKVCREYCQRRGYTIEAVHADLGISGTKPIEARDGLRESVQLCEDFGADTIVAYAQDRFARKTGVFDDLRERAVKGGYRLETAHNGQDLTASENELTGDTMAFVSSLERKLIVARLRGGRKQRAGLDGCGSSSLPYGYTRDGQGRIVVDQAAAKVIQSILALRSCGKSCQATADALNAAKYHAPKGGTWRAGQVYWIAQRMDLYRTGKRVWDGIEAAQQWPAVLQP